jgi:hypothetical protein
MFRKRGDDMWGELLLASQGRMAPCHEWVSTGELAHRWGLHGHSLPPGPLSATLLATASPTTNRNY